MPPRIPKLPSTVSVHGHRLRLEPVPSQTARKTWHVTEQLGAHLVSQAPMHYERGEFGTDTSTGTITDTEWGVVLMRRSVAAGHRQNDLLAEQLHPLAA